jgi:hypothetical protein
MRIEPKSMSLEPSHPMRPPDNASTFKAWRLDRCADARFLDHSNRVFPWSPNVETVDVISRPRALWLLVA